MILCSVERLDLTLQLVSNNDRKHSESSNSNLGREEIVQERSSLNGVLFLDHLAKGQLIRRLAREYMNAW